jgi:isopropylmalate/homocitrate/citramalate synthase
VGLATGGFVAAGDGGGSSISTCLLGEGEGNAGAFRLVFWLALSFALSLRFAPGMSFGFSAGEEPGELLASTVGLAL